MSKNSLIKSHIISEVQSIVKSKAFKDWLINENTLPVPNQFIALNNSFIFRENIDTVKSTKFLAFDITNAKKFDLKQIYVIEDLKFNAHYKIFPYSTQKKTSLTEAIRNELNEIGEVIFSLVGDIKDTIEVSESLNNGHFKKITLNPRSKKAFDILGDEIVIKDCNNIESIWENIEKHCTDNSITIPVNFPKIIDKAVTALQSDAYSNLVIPKRINPTKKYLLDKICMVIEDHIKSYKKNLAKLDTDKAAMIEILRISYNFVTDINKMLVVVITLCDLKPLILWLTISEYINVDNKFKDLPFGFSNTKTSLSEYEKIIKNARNKSFHQLLPFNKSLKFHLATLEKVTVTFFTAHTGVKKNNNSTTYKDQQILELLHTLTRTTEQVVSKNFWVKNEVVMQAIYGLIITTSDAIKKIR